MSGIAGTIDLSPTAPPAVGLPAMLEAMQLHPMMRQAQRHDRAAAFGRIAFPPSLTPGADPAPWLLHDGEIFVCIARLDNRPQLAAAFGWADDDVSAKPDELFVRQAYERWGEACPERLEGTFALASWQPQRRRLFCAVDCRGVYPLYYRHTSNQFAFASTLRGLLAAPGVSRELDARAFANHLVGLRPLSGATLYRDASLLLGGHTLTWDPSGLRLARYWNPSPSRVLELATDADYLAAFREEFTAAVRRSLQHADGDVGLLLSGGLDSSAIAAVAGRILAGRGRRLQAFHAVPRAGARHAVAKRELAESSHVRLLQAHAPHIDFHFVPAPAELAPRDEWDRFFADHLVPFESLLTARNRSREQLYADRGLSLLMTGMGGNLAVSPEAFGGRYFEHLAVSSQWGRWWRETRAYAASQSHPWRTLVRHTAINPWKRLLRGRPPAHALHPPAFALMQPAFRAHTEIEARYREHVASFDQPPRDYRAYLQRVIIAQFTQHLGVSPSVIGREPPRLIMRSPLFDRQLNEFCLALPFDQQFRAGWDRRLLRESMRGLLPEALRLRVTRGFPQPEFQHLVAAAGPLLSSEIERLRASPIVREYFDWEQLRQAWAHRDQGASLVRDHTLVRYVTAAAFLDWHARS